MAKFGFKGGPVLALDAKGRLTVPARYRDVLMAAENGQMVIAKSPDGCLTLYPKSVWDQFEAELAALPRKFDNWRRLYIGSATEVEIDSGARVLIPQELREYAGLQKDVVFMGVIDKFELWDKAKLDEHEKATRAQPMPEQLGNGIDSGPLDPAPIPAPVPAAA